MPVEQVTLKLAALRERLQQVRAGEMTVAKPLFCVFVQEARRR